MRDYVQSCLAFVVAGSSIVGALNDVLSTVLLALSVALMALRVAEKARTAATRQAKPQRARGPRWHRSMWRRWR